MKNSHEGYARLIERIGTWGDEDENVRAVIMIGSRARTDHPADEWADLDVIVAATDPAPYWQTDGWLRSIGDPWLTFVTLTPDGRTHERRALFGGGLDVDFVLNEAASLWGALAGEVPADIADMIHRGVRFLVDKDGLGALLQNRAITPPPPQPPDEAVFLNLVNDFWYHTLWTAKHLRRGELWWAKAGCDMHLKGLLLQMLEWHARATRGLGVDTWLRGRFLEEWADPRALLDLENAFAHYQEADIWRALLATMALFDWLEGETVAAWNFRRPVAGETQTAALVRQLRSDQVTTKPLWHFSAKR